MDENNGGSNRFTKILTKKYVGIPMYVYLAIAVLLLAWYLKRRSAKTEESKNAGSQVGDVTSQTYPSGWPMPWSADVFINQTIPQGNTPVPQPEPVQQKTIHVLAGQSIVDTIMTLQATGHDITWNQLVDLNGDALTSNVSWGPPNPPGEGWNGPARRQDRFIEDATYKIAA